jgi:Fe-S-cluster containining protein
MKNNGTANGLATSLPVVNLADAKFECTFGRGCSGICCQNGRPGLYPDEDERIRDNLKRILPLLRPEARAVVEKDGYVSRRLREGRYPMVRVLDGWCLFFNEGCALHKLGAAEGDKFRYKPSMCSLFPLEMDNQKRWYIRQKGMLNEGWELPCLDPQQVKVPASETLQEELAFAAKCELEGKG